METYERLEETAYQLSEELGFAIGIAQEAFNEMESYEGDKQRAFHYFRGTTVEKLEEAEEMYKESLAVLELAEELDTDFFEEEREEEVRLEKEKWHGRSSHDYTGRVGDAMDAHAERLHEAKAQDLLSHGTAYHTLRSVVAQYEDIAEAIQEQRPDFVNLEYREDRSDSEIFVDGPEENPDQPVDLGDEFFSQTI